MCRAAWYYGIVITIDHVRVMVYKGQEFALLSCWAQMGADVHGLASLLSTGHVGCCFSPSCQVRVVRYVPCHAPPSSFPRL